MGRTTVLVPWMTALFACAPSQSRPTNSGVFHAVRVPVTAAFRAGAAAPNRPLRGPLTRAEAEALVTRGLGAFLATIDVSPVLSNERFVGFRLDGARDLSTWRASGADVRAGDVILRVNGVRVERPEQALWAFERLRVVPELEVEVLRDGERMTIRSPIVETASLPVR